MLQVDNLVGTELRKDVVLFDVSQVIFGDLTCLIGFKTDNRFNNLSSMFWLQI